MLAVQRAAVDVDLGIEGDDIAGLRNDERIDLDKGGVALHVEPIHAMNQIAELAHLLLVEPQPKSQLPRLIILQAGVGLDGNGKDLFGRFRRNLFDVHTARGRSDERNTAQFAIDQHRQVEFAIDIRSFLDINDIDGQAVGT